MIRLEYPASIATLSVVLSLELAIASGSDRNTAAVPLALTANGNAWEIAQTFVPPNRGAPAQTGGAGSRGGSCIPSTEKKLTVLLPISNLGLTVAEYPAFLGYVPKSTAREGEFILLDRNDRLIYRKNFALPSQSGIVSISLPANGLRPLEVGKMYKWNLVIICNPEDRSDNAIASGFVERIRPDSTLENQIKNAAPAALPGIYARAGIWQEAVVSLAKLRRDRPDDTALASDWSKLLDSNAVNLKDFVREPLLDCCQVR